jgi:hypothetical protein
MALIRKVRLIQLHYQRARSVVLSCQYNLLQKVLLAAAKTV